MTRKNPVKQKQDTNAELQETKLTAELQDTHAKTELPQLMDPNQAMIEDLTEHLQRLQAEFENFRKRTEKDQARCREYANADLLLKLLPVIDSFDAALNHTEKHEDFVAGMRLVHSQLMRILEQEGLKPMRAGGEHLDPFRHEVLLQVPSDKDGVVLEELQKGYTFKDKVLRCAKVKVGNHVEKKDEQAGSAKTGKGV
ncbi:MAG: nucleotide exchange factor GrpE [Candidatus Woesearchaeota archaeon]